MKKFLIAVAALAGIIWILLSYGVVENVLQYLYERPRLIVFIILAVVFQLIGHYLRARRTKIILDQAAPSSMRFQFATLSIGYLFNTLLPLRLGEFIRSLLIARRLRISFLYTFAAVVVERAIDILLLAVLILLGEIFVGGISASLMVFIFTASIFAVVILIGLLGLKQENKYLLSFIWKFTDLFNLSIKNSIRFRVWSLIFGFQSFFSKKGLIKKYIAYASISWLFYFLSLLVVVIAFNLYTNVGRTLVASITPYISSVPTWNLLNMSVIQHQILLAQSYISTETLIGFAGVIWLVMTLPMAVIGVGALLLYNPKKIASEGSAVFSNKLLRSSDISQEFPAFLDTYFKGYILSKILHKIEVNGELSLVKFFKGGSDAITVLALKNNVLFVKKIVPEQYTDRLKVQYKWLKAHAYEGKIIKVLAEHKTDDYYAIDLAYDPANVSLFEYIHTHSLAQSKTAIDKVLRHVFKNVYKLEKESINISQRDEYVEERLMKKVESAVMVNDDLKGVIEDKYILINGEKYLNFYEVIKTIKQHKQAWSDIASYRKSKAIHGDLTIDNILINPITHDPIIIDPSDDNQVRGPIIDFARMTQSLVAGYELLNNDDEPVEATKIDTLMSINYHDPRSARYMQLYEYVAGPLSNKYLTETEQRAVLFHTGLLYGRMLAHRVVINPHNTLKYYAISVILFNEFLRQYE